MNPEFEPTQDGLVVVDSIERQHYRIQTDRPVEPEQTTRDPFPFPVDSTISIITGELTLPDGTIVYVKDMEGSLITEVQPSETVSLPSGEYTIDISDPVKVYAYVESGVNISSYTNKVTISFEEVIPVTIGARSYHTRPAATITTTPDPTDLMEAVSMFGSALKATSVMRSYPTYRGHPPAIEIGDEVNIPDQLHRPATGIEISVPSTLSHVFTVAPLAYYLGAKVIPGTKPEITTESGYNYSLRDHNSFSTTVSRVLKQIFFLDCVIRTEGGEPGPLYERNQLEPTLDFDIEHIYDEPITAQLQQYLGVSYSTIEQYLPEWWLTTKINPEIDSVGLLPFIANDLSIISIVNGTSLWEQDTSLAGHEKMMTCNESSNTKHESGTTSNHLVHQLWSDDSNNTIPAMSSLAAHRNSIQQSPRDGALEIKVICNDPRMIDEFSSVRGAYRDQGDSSLSVTIHCDLSRDDLENVFAQETDFIHYIGHINDDGFKCADGTLDANNLKRVGAKAFFLNACDSYRQGLNLIDAGSIGGIVTVDEVPNSTAVDVGRIISELLNRGFPLYAALDIIMNKRESGPQYRILGDTRLTVTQTRIGSVFAAEILDTEGGYELTIDKYVTTNLPKGSLYTPYLDSIDLYYLVPAQIKSLSVTKPELVEFLNMASFPVIFNNQFRWSDEIKVNEL